MGELAGHFRFSNEAGIPTLEFHADPGVVNLPQGWPVRRVRLKEGGLRVAVDTALGEVDVHIEVSAGQGEQAG